MQNYRLSKSAEVDLLNIALHGYKNFGIVQSEKYRDKLKTQFSIIGNHPLRYPTVKHIRAGYRRSVCGVKQLGHP